MKRAYSSMYKKYIENLFCSMNRDEKGCSYLFEK